MKSFFSRNARRLFGCVLYILFIVCAAKSFSSNSDLVYLLETSSDWPIEYKNVADLTTYAYLLLIAVCFFADFIRMIISVEIKHHRSQHPQA